MEVAGTPNDSPLLLLKVDSTQQVPAGATCAKSHKLLHEHGVGVGGTLAWSTYKLCTATVAQQPYLTDVLLVLLFTKFFNLSYFCPTFDTFSYIALHILNLMVYKIEYYTCITAFSIMVLKFLLNYLLLYLHRM